MECRKFEITLVSADNLPDVRGKRGQMRVYATVSLEKSDAKKVVNLKGSDKKKKISQKSPVDMRGGNNPRWNFPVEYTFRESAFQNAALDVKICIKLYCKRTFGKDKYVGHVDLPLKNLFDVGLLSQSVTVSGTPNGKLNISYTFGDKLWVPKASFLKYAAFGIGLTTTLLHGAWFLVTGDFSLFLTNI